MEVFTACKQLKHCLTRTILRTEVLSFGRARVIIMQAGREVLVNSQDKKIRKVNKHRHFVKKRG